MKVKKIVFTGAALLLIGGAGFAYWRMARSSHRIALSHCAGEPRQYAPSGVFDGHIAGRRHGTSRQPGVRHDRKASRRFQYQSERRAGRRPTRIKTSLKRRWTKRGPMFWRRKRIWPKRRSAWRMRSGLWSGASELRKRELMAQSDLDAAQTAYDAARCATERQSSPGRASSSSDESSRWWI